MRKRIYLKCAIYNALYLFHLTAEVHKSGPEEGDHRLPRRGSVLPQTEADGSALSRHPGVHQSRPDVERQSHTDQRRHNRSG